MKFDRKAPGEGVEAVCRLENGKAVIEWNLAFLGTEQEKADSTFFLTMRDKTGQTVLLCMQKAEEEEFLVSVLLHPHLWDCGDPYLYEVEAVLQDSMGKETDRLKKQVPLRELCCHPRRGWMLNGGEFVLKAVEYMIPQHISQAEKRQLVLRDLRLLKEMGANCVRTEPSLRKLCERMGFLTWKKEMEVVGEDLPRLTGETFSGQIGSLFYRYRAKWSDEPFVYIVPEHIFTLPSGNLNVTVYSNCSRVVLYSDGELFEFQSGNEEFIFREVPAKGPCVMLSAEGDDCGISLSVHRAFMRSVKPGLQP
ncbi:MAG: hypothetical protein NC305_07550 [Lachnospiraceae bacterium]|nr:hypothetical protein [Butyrivibrio sp.]MCM1343066.1 hypothetical protein [Muribaculaceae bacterium]MCM1410387.1 hypothetical protein [Lachnospiraceae bacterium]